MPVRGSGDRKPRLAAGGAQTATRHYFEACNIWLSWAFACGGVAEPERRALQATALLQGAMLQAVALADVTAFDQACEGFAGQFA